MCSTNIFATQKRRDILEAENIKYTVNEELNLCFNSSEEKEKAKKILKKALEL